MNILTKPATLQNQTEIKEFLNKMVSQDNRATAMPFFYVIRTEETYHAPIEDCEEKRWYWEGEDYDSWEEIEKQLTEYGSTKEDIKVAKRNAQEYGIKKRWVERGMFLTETDAEGHLKSNHYHYSHNAHTYVKHAWRAPELEKFFLNLFNFFEISKTEQ